MIRPALWLMAAGLWLTASSCDNSFFLRGTLNGDCDAPHVTMTDLGTAPAVLRRSNCQPTGSVCCRRSSAASRTSCQYPEDCYVAPYQGACATAVDCSDTQECTGGSCQCTLGGPPCPNPQTGLVVCCTTGEICMMGACTQPS